jgi:manganese-dependent inorganic pyrophosphatase
VESIYIFGHKNPDTDSICSAIAYAQLKNMQAEGHLPARLGELNREFQFVLNTFDQNLSFSLIFSSAPKV